MPCGGSTFFSVSDPVSGPTSLFAGSFEGVINFYAIGAGEGTGIVLTAAEPAAVPAAVDSALLPAFYLPILGSKGAFYSGFFGGS